jgi:hypothetical protein
MVASTSHRHRKKIVARAPNCVMARFLQVFGSTTRWGMHEAHSEVSMTSRNWRRAFEAWRFRFLRDLLGRLSIIESPQFVHRPE